MGNQTTTPRKNSSFLDNFFSKHNKHFNNAYITNLKQFQRRQLLKDLNIDQQKCQALENDSYSQKQFIHCLQFNDDFTFEKVDSRLSSRAGLTHRHIFNVKNIKVHEQKSLCSISRKLLISQQNYDFTLKNLIMKKSQEKQSFSEDQILNVLNKIVEAVIWMNDNEFKNIILDTQSITFVSEFQENLQSFENYICKIIDQDIVQTSCYKKLLQNLIQRKSLQNSQQLNQKINLDFYLSPELLQEIQNQNFYPNVSLKSDIFTLGMLMMEICCQQEMYFCYNLETMTLDYESLIHRIAKISYSNELKLLIAEMLEYDENNRVGFVSLKQKIDKIMIKPFDETRKLKRRSSSTMLKQLLSCSRASYSLENCSKPTLKNNSSSKISTVSMSVQKKQTNPSFNNENETQNRNYSSLTKHNSLTKSNSLVNLKCKTNSFLTSKKSTLLRVNSGKKLETQSKNVIQKQIKLQTNKVDYSKILKNRMKTQTKNLQRPLGDRSFRSPTAENMLTASNINQVSSKQDQQKRGYIKTQQIQKKRDINHQKLLKPFDALMTDRSIHEDEMDRVSYRTINHSNFQQIENHQNPDSKKKIEQNNFKAQQSNRFNHSFVQKKVINLDNVKVSSSQKMLKSKSLLTNVNQLKSTQSPLKKERFSTQGNQQDILMKINQKLSSIDKSKPKESSISLKKIHDSRYKKLIIQKPEQKVSQEIKNTNKNWILGKLKAKNFIQTKSKQKSSGKQKNKSTGKNKQSSLTKVKTVSFAPQTIRNINTFIDKNQSHKNSIVVNNDLTHSRKQQNFQTQEFRRGDTIIKRLQMTDQKSQIDQGKFQQQDKQQIRSNVKNQIKFVQKVLQKCALSSSRWQQESNNDLNESNFRHQNFMKYSEYKEKLSISQKSQIQNKKEGQFKKKSKIIDIDLGKINNNLAKLEQNKRQLSVQVSKVSQKDFSKNQKQTTSKLRKLKQLTIFTEDQQTKQIKDYSKQQKSYIRNEQNENKQNSIRNSNLQSINIPDIKINNIEQKLRKSYKTDLNQNLSTSLLGFNQIPYQRIEYVNKVSTIINPAITTPSSLNELNKIYGKGMTVESSIQQSAMHRKNNSTLSKPFQEIQLYYENEKELQPHINSPNLNKQQYQENPPQQSRFKKSITIGSIKRQTDIFSMNNSEELTFRLKTNKVSKQQNQTKSKQTYFKQTFQPNQLLNIQKLSYFEKQDGSFVMREQNPLKNIQTSSIIGEKNLKNNQGTGHFQEFFTSSNSRFNNNQIQSQYQGYKQSFLDDCEQDRIMREEDMNSSCSSINLSEIEYKAQKGESLLFAGQQKDHQKNQPNSKQRKYKHISILQPEEDNKNRSHDFSINVKNLKNHKETKNVIIQSNNESQQNTYRGYLKQNDCNSYTIELDDGFIYEGEINQDGQFQGSGIIYRKDKNKGKNIIVYTGSFVNGLYQGFGTLYHIQNHQNKRLRISNIPNRITFGSNRNQSTSRTANQILKTQIPIKYEGEFSQGTQNGFGTYFYSNGDKFSGCIKQGVVQGYGTYHIALTNEVLSGMWKNNVFTN